MVSVEERRLCCLEVVAARCKYQQVDWQRVPNNVFVVHVMKPVLVQKRRRCSASQVADFGKSFIEDLLRRTDYNIMGLLVESKPKPSPT